MTIYKSILLNITDIIEVNSIYKLNSSNILINKEVLMRDSLKIIIVPDDNIWIYGIYPKYLEERTLHWDIFSLNIQLVDVINQKFIYPDINILNKIQFLITDELPTKILNVGLISFTNKIDQIKTTLVDVEEDTNCFYIIKNISNKAYLNQIFQFEKSGSREICIYVYSNPHHQHNNFILYPYVDYIIEKYNINYFK